MTRDRWVALARLHLAEWETLPARDKKTWARYPAPVRVPPAVLLVLLGEPVNQIEHLSPQEGT